MSPKATAIRDDFEVFGRFYSDGSGLCFREFLNIKRRNTHVSTPDFILVGMNPGSSKPVDDTLNVGRAVAARPDQTQDQVMRLMQYCRLNHARILNLSDVREPKSKRFFKMLTSDFAESLKARSIFHSSRERDFQRLLVENVPVVCAWGVAKELQFLARMAVDKIGRERCLGIRKEIEHNAFYHPLPRNHGDKQRWVKQVAQQLIEFYKTIGIGTRPSQSFGSGPTTNR